MSRTMRITMWIPTIPLQDLRGKEVTRQSRFAEGFEVHKYTLFPKQLYHFKRY